MTSIRWAPRLTGFLLAVAPLETAAASQSFTITTVAGTGRAGFSGDGGPPSKANYTNPPVAPDGSLYIADLRNRRIRKVNLEGTITTFAGAGGGLSSGDGGPGTEASRGR